MIKALVDPSIFAPPSQGTSIHWLQTLRRWSQSLRDLDDEIVGPVMSRDAQASIGGITGGITGLRDALARSGSPIGAPDVIRLIEAIRARSKLPQEVFEPTEIVFSTLEASPVYINGGDAQLCQMFTEDLAHAATFAQETNVRVAAVTSEAAWSKTDTEVAVKAEVDVWEKYGHAEEPDGGAQSVSESIALWCSPEAIDQTLREKWTELLMHPKLAIELAYREFTPCEEEKVSPLKVKVGDQLVSSMKAMGYAQKSGKIKAVFHAAAYIGSKRAGELKSLEPHPYRKSAGAGSPAVERSDGAKLMRGTLGRGRNAHRLMWWEAALPEILGVVEHDANPLFLT